MTVIAQDELDQVADAALRALAPRFTPEHLADVAAAGWDEALWTVLEDAGLTLVAADDDLGVGGGTWQVAAEIARLAGRYAAGIPVIETQVAAWLLTRAGADVGLGPMSVGVDCSGGIARRVPYGRIVSAVVVPSASDSVLRVIRPAGTVLAAGRNLAGEPRDDIDVGARAAGRSWPLAAEVMATGAALLRLLRAAQLAGAAEQCLELTVDYVQQRQQFGRTLAKFQTVQQQLAMMAGEVALARAAVDGACAALADAVVVDGCAARGSFADLAVDSAKAQAGISAGRVSRIAHQLHGAIGTTREHRLHLATTRLWAWSAEDGSVQELCEAIGRQTLAAPGATMWPTIAR